MTDPANMAVVKALSVQVLRGVAHQVLPTDSGIVLCDPGDIVIMSNTRKHYKCDLITCMV